MGNTILKECKRHGVTKYRIRDDGYHRCMKCGSEAVTRYRRNVKIKLVNEFGGGCSVCGYNKSMSALHFHHVNPEEKSFQLGVHGLSKSYVRLLEEAKKCVVLCANCHSEIHSN